MVYNVIFNKLSLANIRKLDDYLYAKWGRIVVEKFHDKLTEFESVVAKNPRMGTIYTKIQNREVRQYAITKQNVILYTIDRANIRVLKVFDVRQHPNKKLQGI